MAGQYHKNSDAFWSIRTMQKTVTPPSTLATVNDVQLRPFDLLRAALVSLVLLLYLLPISETPVLMLGLVAGWLLVAGLSARAVARLPLTFPLLAMLAATTISTLFSVDRRSSFAGLTAAIILVGLFFIASDLLTTGWSPSIFIGY